MRLIKNTPIALAVSAALATSLQVSTAFAQESESMLEEVMVTARKREESLAETPIAITAISAAEIQAGAFKSLVDVQKTAPGLFVETMNNENARTVLMPRFRGVTFDASSPLQRTSSVFVDGLIVSSGLHSLPITQVERIEVIKGPQSALFGRNTYSGAINIITRRPGDELKGGIEVDYGAKSKGSTTGYIEGPITSNLGARATFSYTDKEGHYDNAFVEGQRLGDEETLAYGLMLDFNPTEDLNIMVRASSYEDDDGPGAYAVVGGLAEHNFCAEPTPAINSFSCFFVNGLESAYKGAVNIPSAIGASSSADVFSKATGQLRDASGNWAGLSGDGYAPIGDHSFDDLSHNGFGKAGEGERFGAIVSWDMTDSLNLNVAYGKNEDDYVLFHDFDAAGAFGFHVYNARVTEDETFEVRLSGTSDRLNWSIGATQVEMSSKAHGGFYDQYFGDFSGSAGYWFADIRNPDTAFSLIEADTTGIFASVDFSITDKLDLTLEVRRQEDEINDPNVNAAAGKNIAPAEFKSTLPRVVLKYQLNDNHMLYANYSEGTLPGGFNPEVASKLTTPEQISTFNADTPGIGETYEEETLKNFEAGWKYSSNDGRLAMNLAVFHMERADQVYSGFGVIPSDVSCSGDTDGDGVPNTETCTVAFSGNGTSSDIDGLEIDFNYRVIDSLLLQAAVGYTKAEISDFPANGDCGDFNDVFGPGLSCAGQQAARYPEWIGSLIATYDFDTPMGGAYARGEFFYTGSYYDEVTNLTKIPDATELNIRVGVRMDNGISLEAYVSNLTDEDAPTGGNNIADTSKYVRDTTFAYNFAVESVHIHMRDQREAGVRLRWDF
ncbi:TonB-dependent receptor [Luminiphilus sp.]|jgi:iron complex outermembrane receptor protein|nr:TonB-dependent receptor [Luminiphilus sp.]MDA9625420.1 TonB-dependent receptor [Luminiphilus sp.]